MMEQEDIDDKITNKNYANYEKSEMLYIINNLKTFFI